MFAHPDDETFGIGGTLAKYAHEGVHVSLICATRGEAGEISDLAELAPSQTLAELREQELRCAARILGIEDIYFLGYRDSGMADTPDNDDPRALMRADSTIVIGQITRLIRHIRPQVVVTFEEGGGYGHPDHVAISRSATAAFYAASDPAQYPEHLAEGLEPYAPRKLYHTSIPRRFFRTIAQRLEELGIDYPRFHKQDPETLGMPDEKCTTDIDVAAYFDVRQRASECHRSQLNPNTMFRLIPTEVRREFMSAECFWLVGTERKPGQPPETDLFAGLR